MSRVVLLGDSTVGKSSLLATFVDGVAGTEQYSTIGADLRKKTVMVDGKSITLEMWDTSGQLQYQTLATGYVSEADGALIVYDLTNLDSFAHVNNWLHSVSVGAPSDITVMVVGNKLDLKDMRKVHPKHIQPMQKEKGIPFLEASACQPETVKNVFRHLVATMHPPKPKAMSSTSAESLEKRAMGGEEYLALGTQPQSTWSRLCCYCCCRRKHKPTEQETHAFATNP